MVLKYLLEKEMKQLVRHKFMLKLVVLFPLMIMLIMPWATTLDIKNIDTVIVDRDISSTSRKFTESVNASSYFRLKNVASTYEEAIDILEYGNADLVIEIPSGFGNDLANVGATDILVAINTVNSTKGVLGRAYIEMLAAEFSAKQIPPSSIAGFAPKIDVAIKNIYNPLLNYKFTMIPGLMVIVIVLLCGFMPAANIVQEKELGTIEQINVTPISKFTFICAKLIPYWAIGLLALTLCFLLAWLIYGLTPVGSVWTMYLFAAIFILVMTGIGLIISNKSSTMQQATFVMLFFVMIFIMMCGLLTPVQSMPDWAQAIAALTPTKYMVNVMRAVYLKGSGVADLSLDLIALSTMAVVLNLWAVLSYRKTS